MVRQLQPQTMTPEQQIKKEKQELRQLGVVGPTGGGSVEPLPQGPPQPKKEQQELQQLGVMGLTAGGGSVEPLPQGPRHIKKEQQELQRLQQQEQQNKKPGFAVPVTQPRKRTTTEPEAPIYPAANNVRDRTAVPSH